MSEEDKPKIEDEITRMSDRELIAASRTDIENVRQNIGKEPWATPELVADMEAKLKDFEIEVRKCEIADQEVKLSAAKLRRSADAYLAALAKTDKSRGQ